MDGRIELGGREALAARITIPRLSISAPSGLRTSTIGGSASSTIHSANAPGASRRWRRLAAFSSLRPFRFISHRLPSPWADVPSYLR